MCKPTPPGADDATAASPAPSADDQPGATDAAAAAKRDATTMRIITRSELAMRNSPSSAWCAIHVTSGGERRGSSSSSSSEGGGRGDEKKKDDGRYIVLDVTKFANVHPGGDLILLGAGKDASVLFETYHPCGVHKALIEKLRIGTMESGCFDGTFYSWNSDFYPTLKRRVVDRLVERGLTRRGSNEIQIKAVLLLLGFWYSLVKMYTSHDEHFLASAAWSISMGIFAALIGVNIQHDGNHGAFATSKFVNKCAGWTMDMIGASAFTWEMQHMLGHHPYTNVLDVVEDNRKGMGVDCRMEEKDQVRLRFVNLHASLARITGGVPLFRLFSFLRAFRRSVFLSIAFADARSRQISPPPPPLLRDFLPPSRSPTRTSSPPSP